MNNNQLLYVHVLVVLMTMRVEGCQSFCSFNFYKGDNLICTTFNIKNDCCVTGNVAAKRGAVGDSMTATNIFIPNTLQVGDSLECKELLECRHFTVGDDCKAGQIKAEKGIVERSMVVTERAFFSEKLSVKNLLLCCYLVNLGSTIVGNVIAEHSNFEHIYIKKSDQNGLLLGNYEHLCLLGLSRSQQKYKRSEFVNCKVKSIFADESHVIVLRDQTLVTGNITFSENSNGKVWLSLDSCIIGKVINGTIELK